MAFNLFPSLLNRFESTSSDETIHFADHYHSNSILNHVNENGLIINQLIHSNPTVVTTGSHRQNSLIYRSTHPSATGHGQLGLSQRVTGVKRAFIGHNMVRIHSIIDYEFHVQYQPLPPNDFGIVSTPRQFFTPSTSTLERFLAPNNIQNQNNIANNAITTLVPRNPVRVSEAVDNQTTPDQEIDDNNSSDDDLQEYDGRTHSLPHRRNGPYKCPKCRGVFATSQSFAAHISSHYKHETRAQRKFRLAARFKNKKLHFVSTPQGLTLVPKQSVTVNE